LLLSSDGSGGYTIPSVTWAAKKDPVTKPARVNKHDRFTFGRVVAVNTSSVIIKEYDFVKDAEVNRTYCTTDKTEYSNIKKLTDLKPGNDVVIDYFIKKKKRVITMIVKEEKNSTTQPVCLDESLFNFGTVVAVTASNVTISQYDFEMGKPTRKARKLEALERKIEILCPQTMTQLNSLEGRF
jgi:hypothetical protein